MRRGSVRVWLLVKLIACFIILFTVMVFLTNLAIAIIFYFKYSDINFNFLDDGLSSLRSGIATGIPTGIGIWIMSKLKEKKEDSPSDPQ
ncbi:hypothetical protein [Erwinia sp. 9145]|uniref:hypothetical protein n=1 Tax=Erwinia sp. 9145 TaxID=1500895 RepID=UPI000554E1D3|nr:hypothetical protein [Erwinia sp. 9145]